MGALEKGGREKMLDWGAGIGGIRKHRLLSLGLKSPAGPGTFNSFCLALPLVTPEFSQVTAGHTVEGDKHLQGGVTCYKVRGKSDGFHLE